MKFILPSLAWFACSIGSTWAQTQSPPTLTPPLSIQPSDPASRLANISASKPEAANPLPPADATRLDTPPSPLTAAENTNLNNAAMPANGVDLFMQRVAGAGEQQSSVEARIRYHANLFGQQTVGAGIYLQQGTGEQRQFRLELKTAIGQQLMTLQQVCDGNSLWQFQDSGDTPKSGSPDHAIISRIDLRKVRQTLADGGPAIHIDFASSLAWGGLPKLLSGLQTSFRFTRVEAGKLDALPVWVASGSWRPEALATISKDLASQAAHEQQLNLKLLPPQLPEQVCLYVGQDDLFPYRIEYRRRTTVEGRGGGTGREEMTPIVTVEFYEVRLGTAINPREFDYQPGNANVLDNTSTFIKNLEGKK